MRTIPIPRQETDAEGRKLCRWCRTPVPKGRRTFCSHACVHEGMLRSDPGYLRQQTHKRDQGVCADCGTDTDEIKIGYNRLVAFASNGIQAFARTSGKIEKRLGVDRYHLGRILEGRTMDEAEDLILTETANRLHHYHQWLERKAANPTTRYGYTPTHPDTDPAHQRWIRRTREDALEMTPEESRIRRVSARLKSLAEARRRRMQKTLLAAGWHGVGKHKAGNMWQADHIIPVQHGGGGCGLENIQTLCTLCHKRKTAAQAARSALIRRGINPDAPKPPDPQLALAI